MNNPLVSAAIITYNQEDYIEKALASVMEQKTDFDVEVIIGDDASTDRTSSVCERYAREYPNRVTHIRHPSNVGYINNLLAVINHCSGKYVALLEGDDHWTSTTKLADQVRVFEKHPDVSLCFTNSWIDDTEVPERVHYFDRDTDRTFDCVECLEHIVAPTSTFMFKRELFTPPGWFRELATYEYFLIYLLAAKGSIYYLNELTACRTQHYRGQSTVSLNISKAQFSNVRQLNALLSVYPPETRMRARNIVLQTQLRTIPYLISRGNLDLAWRLFREIKVWKSVSDSRRPTVVLQYMKEVARLLASSVGLKQLALRNVRKGHVRGESSF
jgi:hypothetical protein